MIKKNYFKRRLFLKKTQIDWHDHNLKVIHDYFFKRLLIISLVAIVLILIFGTYSSMADNNINLKFIDNSVADQCLNYPTSHHLQSVQVNLTSCVPVKNQAFYAQAGFIHSGQYCLNVFKKTNFQFNLENCNQNPSEVFLVSGHNLFSPLYQKCLANLKGQLTLDICDYNNSTQQNWQFKQQINNQIKTITGLSCPTTLKLNQQISCQAMMQWNLWHQPKSNHLQLLNKYTDGFGLEEWCADFVSYIYKTSGAPFTAGERNGWDEYNANYIVNEPIFSQISAQNYQPQAGDVAYFNYPGGHVEIVVVGGAKPTFIYGDSAQLDPQTGNGNMAANNILVDGQFGQVTYYLSPNQ